MSTMIASVLMMSWLMTLLVVTSAGVVGLGAVELVAIRNLRAVEEMDVEMLNRKYPNQLSTCCPT